MRAIKSFIRSTVRAVGYDLHKLAEAGWDPYFDMRKRLPPQRNITIFDAGANVGQTIQQMRENFPLSTIHAFEPSGHAFKALVENCSRLHAVHLNNVALGAQAGTEDFFETTSSVWNSFLEFDEEKRFSVKQRARVEITTVDDYCRQHAIERIDILKSDTQGFDLEVLKGASGLLAQHCIHLVYLEINFGRMYKNAARLDEIYRFLSEHDFQLISFYKTWYRNGLAYWTDALFVNSYYDAR